MGESIIDVISTAAAVVAIGLVCIAVLLYGDIRRELNRPPKSDDGRQDSRRRFGEWYVRAAGSVLTVAFLAVVVVRFRAGG